MGVSTDRWTPTTYVVDVLIAVYVPDIGILDSIEYDRLSATDLNARTGELTPPGINFCAAAKISSDFVVFKLDVEINFFSQQLKS